MPNVNLTDSRNRDAVVKAEPTGIDEEVRYVDGESKSANTRKILKATVAHDFDTLVKQHEGDAEALGKALMEGDPEVDMEICGLYLWGVSKVYVDSSDGIVYRIEQQEIVRGPDGEVRERRPRSLPESNVDSEIPLTWTGRKFNKQEALRRFVFANKLQIVHINGLTYDFLYGMAKELSEANVLMMVGGGGKGRDPLIFRRGSVPYRGFLEGRIDGDKYLLLLHLSNLELKVPSENSKSDKAETAKDRSAGKSSTGRSSTGKASTKKSSTNKGSANKNSEKNTENKEAAKSDTKAHIDPSVDEGRESDHSKSNGRKKTAVVSTESIAEKSDEQSDDKSSGTPPVAEQEPETVESTAPTSAVTNEDLGVWLKSIRMGKYLKLFVEHEIDVDVLTELTDEDLKELDIPLGSRRRLLRAVEETDNLHAEVANAVKQMTTKLADGKTARQKK